MVRPHEATRGVEVDATRRVALVSRLAPLAAALALLATACASAPPTGAAAAGQADAPSDRPRAAPCSPLTDPGSFELVVLGSGGPRAAGRAGSSYLAIVDGEARALVDVGPGAFVRLGELGVEHRALGVVLLTHLHVDHAGDLSGVVKSRDLAYDQPASFRVVGPGGAGPYPSTTAFLDRLFGGAGAFAYLPSFRNPVTFDATDLDAGASSIVDVAVPAGTGLEVRAVAVDHGDVPAVAYRLERGGRSAVISGDLASKTDAIVELARGADVLVYDTAVLDPPGSPANLYDLHTPPARIGRVAAAAGVGRLVLSHIPPAVDAAREQVLASVRASFDGDVVFAADCQRHVLARGTGDRTP